MKPLSPTSKKNRYLNELRRELMRGMPLQGRGVRMKQRPNGVIIEGKGTDSGAKPPTSVWFRGDWNANSSYSAGEGVCIRGGITAGLYIAHTDAPAGTPPPSPAVFTHWTLLVSGNGMGLWM